MKIVIKNITDKLPSSNPSKNKTIFLSFLVKQVQKTLEIKPKQEIVLEIPSLTTQIKKFSMMKLIEVSDVLVKNDKTEILFIQKEDMKNLEAVENIEDSVKSEGSDNEDKKIKKQFRAKDLG